jgi:hypothetical protein
MDKSWWESGLFLAVGTVAALVLAILPVVMPPGKMLKIAAWSIAGGVLLVVAVLWYRNWYRQKHPEQIRPDVSAVNFSIAGATPDDLLWIANLQKSYYHADAVPLRILQSWYAANPNGFQILRDDQGNRLGNLDVLPVKEEAFSPFITGKLRERDLTAQALFTPAERDSVRDLYVENLIVKSDDKLKHEMAAALLLNRAESILASLGNPASLRYVYGLGATPAGCEFMEKHGFDLITEARERVDRHPLYRIPYSALKESLRLRASQLQ